MKYMSEFIAGRLCQTIVSGLRISASAKYISEYTYARSAMASVEQESVFYIKLLRYNHHRNESKAFKGVIAGFSV